MNRGTPLSATAKLLERVATPKSTPATTNSPNIAQSRPTRGNTPTIAPAAMLPRTPIPLSIERPAQKPTPVAAVTVPAATKKGISESGAAHTPSGSAHQTPAAAVVVPDSQVAEKPVEKRGLGRPRKIGVPVAEIRAAHHTPRGVQLRSARRPGRAAKAAANTKLSTRKENSGVKKRVSMAAHSRAAAKDTTPSHSSTEDETRIVVEKIPALSPRDRASIKPVWAGMEVKQAPKLNEISKAKAGESSRKQR